MAIANVRVVTFTLSGITSLVVALLYSAHVHAALRDVRKHPRAAVLLLALLLIAASSLALLRSARDGPAPDLLAVLSGSLLVWALLAALSIGPWLLGTALLAILSAVVARPPTTVGAIRIGVALLLGVLAGLLAILLPV